LAFFLGKDHWSKSSKLGINCCQQLVEPSAYATLSGLDLALKMWSKVGGLKLDDHYGPFQSRPFYGMIL